MGSAWGVDSLRATPQFFFQKHETRPSREADRVCGIYAVMWLLAEAMMPFLGAGCQIRNFQPHQRTESDPASGRRELPPGTALAAAVA